MGKKVKTEKNNVKPDSIETAKQKNIITKSRMQCVCNINIDDDVDGDDGGDDDGEPVSI